MPEPKEWDIGPLRVIENLLQREGGFGILARLVYSILIVALILFLFSQRGPLAYFAQ